MRELSLIILQSLEPLEPVFLAEFMVNEVSVARLSALICNH